MDDPRQPPISGGYFAMKPWQILFCLVCVLLIPALVKTTEVQREQAEQLIRATSMDPAGAKPATRKAAHAQAKSALAVAEDLFPLACAHCSAGDPAKTRYVLAEMLSWCAKVANRDATDGCQVPIKESPC